MALCNRIGILCAGDNELTPFLPHIEDCKTETHALLTFYTGRLEEQPVVLLYSGVCKVNAAIAAQLLIDRFSVDAILNAGTAGGMDTRLDLFDTAVTTEVCYHDVAPDILTDFHPWLKSVWMPTDPMLLALCRRAATSFPGRVFFGRTVCGESFITDAGRADIQKTYAPLTADMESGAVAQVCHANGVPFLTIRTVTDTAAHSGIENFEKNCARAVGIAADLTLALLREIGKAVQ